MNISAENFVDLDRMILSFILAVPSSSGDKVVMTSTLSSCKIHEGNRANFIIKMLMEQFEKVADFQFVCPFPKVERFIVFYFSNYLNFSSRDHSTCTTSSPTLIYCQHFCLTARRSTSPWRSNSMGNCWTAGKSSSSSCSDCWSRFIPSDWLCNDDEHICHEHRIWFNKIICRRLVMSALELFRLPIFPRRIAPPDTMINCCTAVKWKWRKSQIENTLRRECY